MSHFMPQGGNHVRIMSTVDRRLPGGSRDAVMMSSMRRNGKWSK